MWTRRTFNTGFPDQSLIEEGIKFAMMKWKHTCFIWYTQYSHLLANARSHDLCKVSLIFVRVTITWCLLHIKKISGASSCEDYESNPIKIKWTSLLNFSYLQCYTKCYQHLDHKIWNTSRVASTSSITGRCLWRVSLYRVYRKKHVLL